MGALTNLDEFLLNPQGKTRNNNSGKAGTAGEHSLKDPSPEVVFSASRNSNLTDSYQEETHQRCNVKNPSFVVFFPFLIVIFV